MRSFRKMAVTLTVAGLAAFGAIAGSGGAASAATGQSVTGCSVNSSELALNVTPTCTATSSTVLNPTSFTISANSSFFTVLGALGEGLGQTLAENVTYTLSCSVNGTNATYNGSFQATSAAQSQVVNLQTAVGSPEPNSCTLSNLQGTSLVTLDSTLTGLLGDNTFTFGVSATADTAAPGAMWQQTAKNNAGAYADICVDDAGNGNANAIAQVYQCNSDLAQSWVWTSSEQLVHNGDCLDLSGSKVILSTCSDATSQKWTINGVNGNFNTIVNHSSSQCLTASSAADFTQLTVATCTGAANQKWTGPDKSPA
jgi:hypothetical protein